MVHDQLPHMIATDLIVGHIGHTQARHGFIMPKNQVKHRHRLGKLLGNVPTLLRKTRGNGGGI